MLMMRTLCSCVSTVQGTSIGRWWAQDPLPRLQEQLVEAGYFFLSRNIFWEEVFIYTLMCCNNGCINTFLNSLHTRRCCKVSKVLQFLFTGQFLSKYIPPKSLRILFTHLVLSLRSNDDSSWLNNGLCK